MTERGNIRRFQLPENHNREKLPFDDKVEITEDDWWDIHEFARSITEMDRWRSEEYNAADSLLAIHTLDQNEPLPNHPDGKKWIPNWLKDCRGTDGEWVESLLRVAALSKTYFPDVVPLTDKDWSDAINRFQRWARGGELTIPIQMRARARIIAPKRSFGGGEGGDFWVKAVKDTEQKRDGELWDPFAQQAANLRIVLGYRPKISTHQWAEMKELLNDYRETSHWDLFPRYAAALKILAAYDVQVTNKGLEITMHKPGSGPENIQPVPEPLEV